MVITNDTELFLGRTVLLSTGVEFRKLRARNLAAYMGRGVTYGSPDMRIPYKNSRMFVVGGANSAGQAAVYLSSFEACGVTMLVRGDSIEDKMSGYLVDKVAARDNIVVRTNTELVG
ncbi:MAG: NAD(P)/FAD-dependent oxidoreductase, partial [Minisyncoccia bacterium]